WEPVAERFSDFTLARVWSMSLVFSADHHWLSLDGAFGPREQALLRACFREGPTTTDWPEGVHHHFTDGRAYLWLFGGRWMAGSGSLAALRRLTRQVWHVLGTHVVGWGDATEAELLEPLQREPPPYPGPGWGKVFGDDLAARLVGG